MVDSDLLAAPEVGMIVILAFRVSLVRIILFLKMGIYEPLEVACTYFISM